MCIRDSYEDGVEQKLVFFATIKEPFHVVLMLDTSASTQEKLGEIQRAAKAFVAQLQPADRVKVISFDDEVHDIPTAATDPESEMLRGALRDALDQAIANLPLEFREIVILRDVQGLSYAEIAEVAGIPVGTVMSRLSRARQRLQRVLPIEDYRRN